MTSHHLILEPFPEILKTIFNSQAFKLVYVFDCDLVISTHFNLQPWNSFKSILGVVGLILIRIEQIIYFFIIELNILARNCDFIHVAGLVLLQLYYFKQVPNCPRN